MWYEICIVFVHRNNFEKQLRKNEIQQNTFFLRVLVLAEMKKEEEKEEKGKKIRKRTKRRLLQFSLGWKF